MRRIKRTIKITLLTTVFVMMGNLISKAQNDNPFGLVYGDAITENIKGMVNIHPVSYTLNGIDISANVYTPANYDPAKQYAAIVVSHPNGGVKEQTAGLYAQRLAENGYITIAADASYQGASGGEPRNTDKPQNRIEDVRGMVDFISSYAGVDADKIGALGICGGGGYTFAAAQSDKRLKAVATLSLFNTGRVRRNGFLDAQKSTIQDRLQKAAEARKREHTIGEISYEGDAQQLTKAQIKETMSKLQPGSLYHDGMEYYGITHAHPNSTGRYTTTSLMDLMTFDSAIYAEFITQPLLIIAGSKADTYYMSKEAYDKSTEASDKELFIIEGASHIQTYWVPEYVNEAVDKMKTFFDNKL